jgi:predicted RNase H-like nuclease (RuvC/YqgF family)
MNDQSFKDLEAAVGRALEEIERLRRRADESDRRCAELETLLGNFQAGDENPAAMKSRLTRLETENRDLHERIGRGRETVERLLARMRFLEDQQT